MCGATQQCCCCCPIRGGVQSIAIICQIAETAAFAYELWMTLENNGSFRIQSGGENASTMIYKIVALSFVFALATMTNILLFVGALKANRWFVVPWLVLYMLAIIIIALSIPLVVVWFLVVSPVPALVTLALIPSLVVTILVIFWTHINGFFIKLSMDEIRTVKQEQDPVNHM